MRAYPSQNELQDMKTDVHLCFSDNLPHFSDFFFTKYFENHELTFFCFNFMGYVVLLYDTYNPTYIAFCDCNITNINRRLMYLCLQVEGFPLDSKNRLSARCTKMHNIVSSLCLK